jgi:type IV pilus assembly protein PilC
MEFQCRLGTPQGEVVEGIYAAENEARLRHELEEKGLLVLDIRARGALGGVSLPGLGGFLSGQRKVSSREFLVFNQELATLLKAGLPLVQSLDILRRSVPNQTFKAVLDDVHERVRAGTSLSEAFEAHATLFPGVYTASLMAGEKSGNLDQVLRRFIAYVKIIGNVKRKTMSALMYPVILLLLSVVVVMVIMIKVVPSFADFYGDFGAKLPWITQILIVISDAITHNLLLILIVVGGGSVAFWRWFKVPGQRQRLHAALMRAPFIGGTVTQFATSQLARTLATLLSGGIPLVTALDVASRAVGNRAMAWHVREVTQQVREGQPLAVAMNQRGVFPDVAVKMVEVGEATGALQDMLNALADFYDEDIETTLARFVTLVEPLMLVIMGLVIAVLLLALYMPVFNLSATLGS